MDQIFLLLFFGALVAYVLTFFRRTRTIIARTVLAPRHISLHHARWALGLSTVLLFVLFGFFAPRASMDQIFLLLLLVALIAYVLTFFRRTRTIIATVCTIRVLCAVT
jgi:hypothetical protein